MATSACNIDSCPPENDTPENGPGDGSPEDEAGAQRRMARALARAVGQRLRAQRRARGLSQEELGWRAGCCRTWISRVERGVTSATLVTLQRLALALGVPLASFCPDPKPSYDRAEGEPGCAVSSAETGAAG